MKSINETKVNVAQLLQEPIGSGRAYQFQSPVEIGQAEEVSFKGQLDLLRTDKGILVHAWLEALIPETCSRCLTSFTYPLQVEFREEFYPTVEVNLGYRLPPPEDSSAFTIDENHILDVEEAIRQYALLAQPLKPLCQPNCAGLCPYCGKNLNEGPCRCPSEAPAPCGIALHELEVSTRGH